LAQQKTLKLKSVEIASRTQQPEIDSLSAISQQDSDSLETALLNYYNSQTTAHAGYIIALAVGLFAIVYQQNFEGFFTKNSWRNEFKFSICLYPLY
jgi:hypothetical protein